MNFQFPQCLVIRWLAIAALLLQITQGVVGRDDNRACSENKEAGDRACIDEQTSLLQRHRAGDPFDSLDVQLSDDIKSVIKSAVTTASHAIWSIAAKAVEAQAKKILGESATGVLHNVTETFQNMTYNQSKVESIGSHEQSATKHRRGHVWTPRRRNSGHTYQLDINSSSSSSSSSSSLHGLNYTLQHEHLLECEGDTFKDCWDFLATTHDPTDGYVEYVSYDEAASLGIYQVNGSKGSGIYLGAVTGNGGPAKSIRLESKSTFNGGLFVIDIEHMPIGLGTWPAWWSYGPDWPNNGEIDTIECVNSDYIHSTCHTSSGCYQQIYGISDSDCNAPGDGTIGCGLQTKQQPEAFNDGGGGVFVTLWYNGSIAMWMFSRDDIPADITNKRPNPLKWRLPYARFPIGWNTNCHYEYFQRHAMVINLDFCGDWAGGVFPGSGAYAAGSDGCNEYVANTEISEAYWLINYVQVYNGDLHRRGNG